MSTADTVDEVPVKRGKTKKEDKSTPTGDYIAEQAKAHKERKKHNKVVEKFYEMRGSKLSLVKVTATGTVHRTFVGSIADQQKGREVKEFVEKLSKEGRLRHRV